MICRSLNKGRGTELIKRSSCLYSKFITNLYFFFFFTPLPQDDPSGTEYTFCLLKWKVARHYTEIQMIKIPQSSGHFTPPHSSERKGPVTPGSVGGKAPGMAGKGSLSDPEKPLFLRQKSLSRLLKELSAVRFDIKGGEPGKALAPMRALLSLLKSARPPAGSPDLLLAEKFLQAWTEKYEGDFPEKISREIRFLSRLLKSEYQDRRETASEGIYLEGEFQQGEQTPVWSMAVSREKNHSSREGQELSSCILNLNLPEIGPVRAVLQYGEKESRCSFYSNRRSVRQLIRGGLKEFRRQLNKRGFQKLRLRVGRHSGDPVSGRDLTQRGVELWG